MEGVKEGRRGRYKEGWRGYKYGKPHHSLPPVAVLTIRKGQNSI